MVTTGIYTFLLILASKYVGNTFLVLLSETHTHTHTKESHLGWFLLLVLENKSPVRMDV